MPTSLAGVTVWAETVGALTGFGGSRRANVLDAPFPHLVTRGHGTFISPTGEHIVHPGDMFCIWPQASHEFFESPTDPWHFYWMRLTGEGALAFARELGFSEDIQVLRPPDPDAAIRCCRELFELYGSPRPRDPYRAVSLLYQLLSVCRAPARQNLLESSNRVFVDEARALIESLMETGVNVSQLAEMLHTSRNRLLYAFKQVLGLSPVQYLGQSRLERAKRLLTETDRKISAVAAACGYGHEKYFLRRFRELTGVTPGEWRRLRH